MLVAVRNEAPNIESLISQILEQSYSLFELIIIDDHSTDETISLLKKHTNSKIKWYQLPEGKKGKKEAIKFGLTKCNYPWIILTDADAKFQKDWLLSYISKMTKEAIIVSPVFIEIKNSSFFEYFQQLDFAAMQYITIAAIIAKKPFLCSGANIAIPKNRAIELYNTIQISIPSGDDVFLLHKHIELKGNVVLNVLPSSVVFVPSTKKFVNFLQQRLRWASKAKYYKNRIALYTSLLIFLIHFCLLIGLIWGIKNSELLTIIFAFFIIKMLIDLPLFIVGNKIIPLHKKWYFYYPLVSLTYFLYISTIAILSFIVPIKWKNRTW
ncbi:MAG: glycosyltransferase [Bacteroidales bacterium]